MKSLAVRSIFNWSLILAACVFAQPASAQMQGVAGKQPLNQLPPIVSPDGKLSNEHMKKSLFLPPIVKGSNAQDSTSMLPPIVQGNAASSMNLPPAQSMPTTALPSFTQQSAQPLMPPTTQQNFGPPNVAGTQSQGTPLALPKVIPPQNSAPRVSAAGVPIYPPSNPAVNNVDYTGQPGINVGQTSFSGFPQGSDTRNVPGPANQLPPIVSPDSLSPANQQSPIPDVTNALEATDPQFSTEPATDLPNVVAPSTVMDNSASPQPRTVDPAGIGSGAIAPGIVTPATPGTNDYFSAPSQPLVSGGQVVDTGCSTCGSNGCYDLNQVQSQFGCCGSVVSAGYYVFADGLVWTRGDGDVQFSNNFALNQFSWQGGLRFTFGYRQNATQGRELTYLGTGDIDDDEIRTSASSSLDVIFSPVGGFDFGDVSGFATANRQEHQKSSSVHSLEYNRVNWGWDVFKTILGVRYIYFDDDTSFFSTNGNLNHNGFFTQDSVNNLFGAQTGFELFYDVGYRASASLTTKGGAYVNSANVDTNMFNFGSQVLAQDTDDAAVASSLEIGFLSHFQLRPKARFRLGYDVLLMWGLFTVENNVPRTTFANGFITGLPVVSPLTGSELNTNNEVVVFHGLSLGFEFYR